MDKRHKSRYMILSISLLFMLFILSFVKVYIRTQTTLVGYDLGELKEQEADLLEQLSRKKMSLAAISTKSNLKKLTKIDRNED